MEVDGGEYEKLDVVTTAVRDKKVVHPVLWDLHCRNTQEYGVRAWPVAYLIGVDGRVIWEGNPARAINRKKTAKALTEVLENEIRKVAPTNSSAPAKDPGRNVANPEPPKQR